MNANHKGWLYYLIVNYLFVRPSNSTVEIFSNPVSNIDFFGYILPFEVLRSKSINPSDFIAYIFQSNYGRFQYNQNNQIWIFLNAQNFTFF